MFSQASKSEIFLLLHLYMTILYYGTSNPLRNAMMLTSECICPGFNVTYECTVMGTENGFTVWQGSALDCIGNEIALRHRLYTSTDGAQGECNSGSILGRSLRLEAGSFYVSQLIIRNSSEVIGESIECVLFDVNATGEVIGHAIVNTTIDPIPPDEVNVNLSDLGLRQLQFSWNPVVPDCPDIHYNILASNCGSCPTTTNHTNVTCIDKLTQRNSFCTFALQTVVCGDITGSLSNTISVPVSLPDNNREHADITSGNTNSDGHTSTMHMPVTIFTNRENDGKILPLAVILSITVLILLLAALVPLSLCIHKKKLLSGSCTQRALHIATKHKTQEVEKHSKVSQAEDDTEVTKIFDNRLNGIYNLAIVELDIVDDDSQQICRKSYVKDDIKTDNRLNGTYNIVELDAIQNDQMQESVQGSSIQLTLSNLLVKLQGQASSCWYQLGFALGVPKSILEELRDYSDRDALVEILDYWLKDHSSDPHTWQDVGIALRKAGFTDINME